MTGHDVVIAGGGPTGLMLAGELALAGVDAVVVERRATQDLDDSRAGGLHTRTIEVLDQRGIAARFVDGGTKHPALGFAGFFLDITDFPTRHNYLLGLWQRDFEPILAGWVEELGVPILRSRDVVGFTQDDAGVQVELSDGTTLRCSYLVGCDGGRSIVRKQAGIDFAGVDASVSFILAELDMDETPVIGMRPEGGGIGPVDPQAGGGPYRAALKEDHVELGREPTEGDLRALLLAKFGTDFGMHTPNWITRFTDMSRQAVTYRRGRVLIAGDAAHVHAPYGGQGMNVGLQDAVNLGWKLGQVIRGESPDSLLDTYHDERHPVGARVLHNTLAQGALLVPDDRHVALRDLMTDLLAMDEPRRRIAGMVSGLDVHYPPTDTQAADVHPLVGRRMPDLDLDTAEGPTRVSAFLHEARPILLNFGEPGAFELTGWTDRVRVVDATTDGPWTLPVLGDVDAPRAALIRPDGHVAWTGTAADPTLAGALTTWFGPPT